MTGDPVGAVGIGSFVPGSGADVTGSDDVAGGGSGFVGFGAGVQATSEHVSARTSVRTSAERVIASSLRRMPGDAPRLLPKRDGGGGRFPFPCYAGWGTVAPDL